MNYNLENVEGGLEDVETPTYGEERGLLQKARTAVAGIAGLALVATGAGCAMNQAPATNPGSSEIVTKEYEGEILDPAYNVQVEKRVRVVTEEIEGTDMQRQEENCLSREVELDAKAGLNDPDVRRHVTATDYQCDGEWESIRVNRKQAVPGSVSRRLIEDIQYAYQAVVPIDEIDGPIQ